MTQTNDTEALDALDILHTFARREASWNGAKLSTSHNTEMDAHLHTITAALSARDSEKKRADEAEAELARVREASQWQSIETAPKDVPILGLCNHGADPYFSPDSPNGERLTIYAAHVEGLSHCDDGPMVLVWGGGWSDSYEDGGGSVPDWWFQYGSEFECAANPTHWMPIPNLAGG